MPSVTARRSSIWRSREGNIPTKIMLFLNPTVVFSVGIFYFCHGELIPMILSPANCSEIRPDWGDLSLLHALSRGRGAAQQGVGALRGAAHLPRRALVPFRPLASRAILSFHIADSSFLISLSIYGESLFYILTEKFRDFVNMLSFKSLRIFFCFQFQQNKCFSQQFIYF